ncbi:MAG: prolyl oligopeptidase family serine peptidase [Planctomycetes bacterium]|nr:prolyl oligopeptidase family serine peptidase [Planctomycetota bacterium]
MTSIRAIVWTLVACGTAAAQGTRADYERAAKLFELTRDTVDGGAVSPRFLGDSDRFWYRTRTGPGTARVVLVDPATSTREELFDSVLLSERLLEQHLMAIEPHEVPIHDVELSADATSAQLTIGGTRWTYRIDTRTFSKTVAVGAARGLDPRRAPASTHGGASVPVTFVNEHATPVGLFWIDGDGARRAYGTLAPQATLRQHTFVGHTWVAVDEGGDDVVAFVVQADADRYVVPESAVRDRDAPAARGPTRLYEPTAPARVEDGVLVWTASDGSTQRLEAGPGMRFADEIVWSAHDTAGVARRVPVLDERRIPLIESSPRDQVQPKLHWLHYPKPGDPLPIGVPALLRCDEGGVREIPITPSTVFDTPWAIDPVRWSADASRFTVQVVTRGHTAQRVFAVDAKTGVATVLVENVSDTFVDSTQKSFLHWIDGGDDTLLWMSERSGWNRLERVDARTPAAPIPITPDGIVVKRVVHTDDASRRVWFLACGVVPDEDPYHEHLCVTGYDGSGFTRLTSGDATHAITFTPSRAYFVDVASRVDLPPVSVLRRSDDGSVVFELESARWDRLLATGWRPPERFVAKGRDGTTDIWGILYRPTNFDPQRRYPVVEQIYAGPHDAHVPRSFSTHDGAREIAELGFVVVRIDGMGTNWRSKAFHDVCWRNLSDAGLPDRIAWLRAAAATRPELDLDRVGIYGGSAGGQNALSALLHHGDFYKVGVADCGCHDNRMDKVWWNEAWMGFPIGPWYADQSNVTHAAKLTGKLLLIVGELDRNVDPASTMQVVDALIAADRDFDLLVMPGVGHGAAESPYGSRRRADFLVRHLLGVEPRAP